MSRSVIVLLTLAGLFVALCMVASIGGVVALVAFGRDIPEPDVSDLALERPAFAEEDNAYAVYEEAIQGLHWPEDDTWVKEYLDGSPVEEAQVADFVERNAEALDVIRQARTRAYFVFPIVDDPDMPVDYKAGRYLASLLAVKARHERLSGQYDEALEAVELLLYIGRHIHAGTEGLRTYFTGERFVGGGVTQAADLARDHGLPRDRLDRLARALDQNFVVGDSLARAYKGEFHGGLVMMQSMEQDLGDALVTANGPVASHGIIIDFVFQPNRTNRDSAEMHRQIISMIPMTHAEFKAMAPDKLKQWETSGNVLSAMMRPNLMGRLLYSGLATAFPELHASKCWTDSQIAGTSLLVALIRHRADTGVLPEELQALVPKYIESIPADPYDGKPFRYSKDKGIVYAVGINLEDSGGSTAPLDSPDVREHTQYQLVEDVVFPLSE